MWQYVIVLFPGFGRLVVVVVNVIVVVAATDQINFTETGTGWACVSLGPAVRKLGFPGTKLVCFLGENPLSHKNVIENLELRI